jgi:pyridoxine kinase
LHFDAFYTGYLASPQQVEQVLQMRRMLCDDTTHVFVDPAFADHGRLYSLMPATMPARMLELVKTAHTIVPNLTEAAFLLSEPYRAQGYDAGYIRGLAERLSALGPERIVITDVSLEAAEAGVAVYNRAGGSFHIYAKPKLPGVFHGTGDVFASFLLSGLLGGLALDDAAQLALRLTHECIRLTLAGGEPLRYGVQFERVLPELIAALGVGGQ